MSIIEKSSTHSNQINPTTEQSFKKYKKEDGSSLSAPATLSSAPATLSASATLSSASATLSAINPFIKDHGTFDEFYSTRRGRSYYVCKATKSTSWEKPLANLVSESLVGSKRPNVSEVHCDSSSSHSSSHPSIHPGPSIHPDASNRSVHSIRSSSSHSSSSGSIHSGGGRSSIASSIYVVGNSTSTSYLQPSQIIHSTYPTNSQILRDFIRIRDANPSKNLYVVGVKYRKEGNKGGDIQLAISETSQANNTLLEDPLDNGHRGFCEEAQTDIDRDILKLHSSFNVRTTAFYNYTAQITTSDQYRFPPKNEIIAQPEKDDKRQKAIVYVYGELDALVPIVRNFVPFLENSSHDSIDGVALIPFKDLESWIK